LDVFHQPFERWSFDVATGESTIVVSIVNDFPAFVYLAANVRFSGVALCIK
jgi:hypothetical protein